MWRRMATVATAVGLLAFAAIALANAGSKNDPAGDVKHDPPGKDARSDIVKISYKHGPGTQLVHVVKTKGKIIAKGGPNGTPPILWIDVPGNVAQRPGCQYSDYFVTGSEVDECGEGPKTGDATIKKLDSHRLRFSFDAAAIGNPNKYGIAFVNEGSRHGKLIFFDRAPNKGFLKHQLK